MAWNGVLTGILQIGPRSDATLPEFAALDKAEQ